MTLRPRTVAPGQATPKAPALLKQELVNTATLIRGRVYFYKDKRFDANEVVIVDDPLAAILEELHETVTDSDQEAYEKPMFDVRRNVPPPSKEQPVSQFRRPAIRLPVRRTA